MSDQASLGDEKRDEIIRSIQLSIDDRRLYYKDVPKEILKQVLLALKVIAPYAVKREGELYSFWKDDDNIENQASTLLKTLRQHAKLSQKDCAERLGIQQYNLSRLETGRRAISKAMAKKLGQVFNMNYRAFL